MRHFKYIFRNAKRNRLRSLLTALSVGICLAMMTVLYAFITAQDELLPELAKANRMIVMNAQGFADTLPIASLSYVRGLEGVTAAIPLNWYIGVYKDERLPFNQLGTDAQEIFRVWSEFRIAPEQLQAWQANRSGCIADRRTAERRGWEVGEHIPLKGSNYEVDLDLTLCGLYDAPEFIQDVYFHWEYLDELLRRRNSPKAGSANILFVKAQSAEVIPSLCRQIDERYASSDHPTLTQSHQAFAQMFSKFAGNLQLYIRNLSGAVILSLMLVAANAMAMSMRERTTEVAVLKAIGFSRRLVLLLVLGESLIISLAGGLLGVGAGRSVWALVHAWWPQFVPIGHVSWFVLGYGVLIAAAIGLFSGIVPALRAAQLPVIDGLRRVV